MRFLIGVACIVAGVGGFAADVRVEPTVAPVGTKLVVSPAFDLPAGEVFKAWNICAYCRDVPPAFAARYADRTNAKGGKRWASFGIRDYVWTKEKPASLDLDTAGWPAGDYSLRFQYYAKKDGKDVYASRNFGFTLTEKAARRDLTGGWRGGFVRVVTHEKAEVQTRWKLEEDDDNLYFRIVADEPDAKRLASLKNLKHLPSDDSFIFRRDCVEVNVDPTGKGESFYKVIVNPNGDMSDSKLVDDNTGTESYTSVREWASHAAVSTRFGEGVWGVEVVLPKGAMDCPPKDGAWGIAVARARYISGWKAENSMSYPAGKGKFTEGRTFPKFAVTGGVRRAWELTTPKLSVASVGGKLSAKVETSVMNRTGAYGRVRVKTTLESRKGVLGQGVTDVSALNGELTPVTVEVPVTGQGAALCRVEILSATGLVLREAWQNATVAYDPVRIRLLRPCYRDCVFETMKLKTIEGEVLLEEGLGKPLEVVLTGPGTDERRRIASAAATNRFAFAFAGKAKGDYEIRVGKVRKTVHNLPYLKNEVWFDDAGVCYRDGKKFLPFGWFSEQYRAMHPGLTIAQQYSNWYRKTETIVERCRQADEYGLGFVGMPFHSFDEKYSYEDLFSWTRMQGEFGLDGEIGEAQKRMVRMFVETAREQPGFFAYYLVDEPEGKGFNPDFFVAAREYITALDPYHPTIVLNYSKWGALKFKDCGDINCPDAYPKYYKDGKTQDPKRDLFDKARLAFDNGRASGWIVPQAFDWPVADGDREPRGPNYDEYREQHMMALAGNTKGFMLYTRSSDGVPSVSQSHAWRYVLDEIVEARETFLATSEYPKTAIRPKSAEKSVFVAAKRLDGDVLLIVSNAGYEPVEVEVDASALPKRLYLSDVGETKVGGKTFRISLAASETRVYRSKPWTFSIRKARAELAALEAARRKPGNLCVAPEFLTWGEIVHRNYKGKTYSPWISVSSAYFNYPTRSCKNFGYFLQDGFDASYPYERFHAWGPRGEDKAPWVKVDFGEKKRFSKVVLCRNRTKDGRYPLKAAAIEVDGREVALFNDDGTAGDKVTLEFPAVESQSFTVRIKSADLAVENYLLTEIEAY